MLGKSIVGSVALFACLSIRSGAFAAQTSAPAQQVPAAPVTTTSDGGQTAIDGGVPTYIKPESAEERRLRVGPVDPGPDPDEKTIFFRNSRAYHIAKFEKRWAAFDQPPGAVRPFAGTPFVYELYQQNEQWVWVWILEPGQDQPAASAPKATGAAVQTPTMYGPFTEAQIKYLKRMKPEFSTLNVPDADVTIRFEESSAGLPTDGSWRNSLTTADMNGDGFVDIIAPPQRGTAVGLPSIFLGDGKGHWTRWQNLVWPYRIDYGSVVAADFNKDGHMDLAFAVHLQGVRVFLGDGKGHFTDSSEGLPSGWGSRAIVAADVNGDGYDDLIAITEGPSRNSPRSNTGKIQLFLNENRGAKWKPVDIADRRHSVAGDYLAVGRLNGDRVPDVVSANIFFGNTDNVFLSQKNKLNWASAPQDGSGVPSNSYYFAVTTAPLTSKKTDDALLSFVRIFPDDAEQYAGKPELAQVVGIDRMNFAGAKPVRAPIIRFASARPISGMATGDFDGDGNRDVIFSRFDPRECVILLGDGKGGFKRAAVEGLPLENLSNYDLHVADVNGDGLPDVIVAYESGEVTLGPRNGSIHVFLNKGTVKRAAPAGSAQPKGTKPNM